MKITELLEGITIDPTSNALKFNYADPAGASTSMGKGKSFAPFIKKDKILDGYTVYSVYSSTDDITTDVLKAIKRRSDTGVTMGEHDYAHFIKRTAIFITAKILAPQRVDVIITPKSSTNILNDLLAEIGKRNPHIVFYPESLIKVPDFSKIIIDRDDPRITPAIIAALDSILKKSFKTGNFEIKKALPQYRKFFKNYFEVVDQKLFAKLSGKNVCVIDDVMSSGTTQLELMRNVASYDPASVFGAVIYKTGSSKKT